MYEVTDCDLSKADCIHKEVCSKAVGYICEGECKFKCDYYVARKSDSDLLMELGEKYFGESKNKNK